MGDTEPWAALLNQYYCNIQWDSSGIGKFIIKVCNCTDGVPPGETGLIEAVFERSAGPIQGIACLNVGVDAPDDILGELAAYISEEVASAEVKNDEYGSYIGLPECMIDY